MLRPGNRLSSVHRRGWSLGVREVCTGERLGTPWSKAQNSQVLRAPPEGRDCFSAWVGFACGRAEDGGGLVTRVQVKRVGRRDA